MGRTWSPGLPTDWLYKTWENCLTLCLLISMKVEREEIIIQYLFPRVALGIGIKSVQYQDRETPNKQNLICVSQQYSGSLTSTLTLCPGPLLHIRTSLWKQTHNSLLDESFALGFGFYHGIVHDEVVNRTRCRMRTMLKTRLLCRLVPEKEAEICTGAEASE